MAVHYATLCILCVLQFNINIHIDAANVRFPPRQLSHNGTVIRNIERNRPNGTNPTTYSQSRKNFANPTITAINTQPAANESPKQQSTGKVTTKRPHIYTPTPKPFRGALRFSERTQHNVTSKQNISKREDSVSESPKTSSTTMTSAASPQQKSVNRQGYDSFPPPLADEVIAYRTVPPRPGVAGILVRELITAAGIGISPPGNQTFTRPVVVAEPTKRPKDQNSTTAEGRQLTNQKEPESNSQKPAPSSRINRRPTRKNETSTELGKSPTPRPVRATSSVSFSQLIPPPPKKNSEKADNIANVTEKNIEATAKVTQPQNLDTLTPIIQRIFSLRPIPSLPPPVATKPITFGPPRAPLLPQLVRQVARASYLAPAPQSSSSIQLPRPPKPTTSKKNVKSGNDSKSEKSKPMYVSKEYVDKLNEKIQVEVVTEVPEIEERTENHPRNIRATTEQIEVITSVSVSTSKSVSRLTKKIKNGKDKVFIVYAQNVKELQAKQDRNQGRLSANQFDTNHSQEFSEPNSDRKSNDGIEFTTQHSIKINDVEVEKPALISEVNEDDDVPEVKEKHILSHTNNEEHKNETGSDTNREQIIELNANQIKNLTDTYGEEYFGKETEANDDHNISLFTSDTNTQRNIMKETNEGGTAEDTYNKIIDKDSENNYEAKKSDEEFVRENVNCNNATLCIADEKNNTDVISKENNVSITIIENPNLVDVKNSETHEVINYLDEHSGSSKDDMDSDLEVGESNNYALAIANREKLTPEQRKEKLQRLFKPKKEASNEKELITEITADFNEGSNKLKRQNPPAGTTHSTNSNFPKQQLQPLYGQYQNQQQANPQFQQQLLYYVPYQSLQQPIQNPQNLQTHQNLQLPIQNQENVYPYQRQQPIPQNQQNSNALAGYGFRIEHGPGNGDQSIITNNNGQPQAQTELPFQQPIANAIQQYQQQSNNRAQSYPQPTNYYQPAVINQPANNLNKHYIEVPHLPLKGEDTASRQGHQRPNNAQQLPPRYFPQFNPNIRPTTTMPPVQTVPDAVLDYIAQHALLPDHSPEECGKPHLHPGFYAQIPQTQNYQSPNVNIKQDARPQSQGSSYQEFRLHESKQEQFANSPPYFDIIRGKERTDQNQANVNYFPYGLPVPHNYQDNRGKIQTPEASPQNNNYGPQDSSQFSNSHNNQESYPTASGTPFNGYFPFFGY